MRLPVSKSLIERGDQFIFLDLRPPGLVVAAPEEAEWPVRVLTIFSVSTGGKLAYRIEMCENEEEYKLARAKDWDALKAIKQREADLFSAYYHIALQLIEEGIWAHTDKVDSLNP